jgi:hypothetical protein
MRAELAAAHEQLPSQGLHRQRRRPAAGESPGAGPQPGDADGRQSPRGTSSGEASSGEASSCCLDPGAAAAAPAAGVKGRRPAAARHRHLPAAAAARLAHRQGRRGSQAVRRAPARAASPGSRLRLHPYCGSSGRARAWQRPRRRLPSHPARRQH